MSYLLVFLGAGLGGICRFLTVRAVAALTSGFIFPFGTLVVNMVGCFLIGFLAQLSESRAVLGPEARLFLFVGLLGGFTTFSSFGYETVELLRTGQVASALANAVLQVALGLLLVWMGFVVARTI